MFRTKWTRKHLAGIVVLVLMLGITCGTSKAESNSSVQIARDKLAHAQGDSEKSKAHYELGLALQKQGIDELRMKLISDSSEEFEQALDLDSSLAMAHYYNGISRAYLRQDNSARLEFAAFLKQDHESNLLRVRARRYEDRIDLARAKKAPEFFITTIDGQKITSTDLKGKVVLVDFWATWCRPCVAAMPHLQKLAHKYSKQPFVLISINVDKDEQKWKDFVAKNSMTWSQVRDTNDLSKQFHVVDIPTSLTIDADGVLEDQRTGDGSLDKKLKAMITDAIEMKKATAAKNASGQ